MSIPKGTISTLASNYTPAKNHVGRHRRKPIKYIIPHHGVTTANGQDFANYFASTNRKVNANYVIGNDGVIVGCLAEEYRPWTTGNVIDEEAITIEVANSVYAQPWPISDKAMNSLIELCADIAKRYDLFPVSFTGDESGTLLKHKYYMATSCPGPYLSSKFDYIAEEVNKLLKDKGEVYDYGSYPPGYYVTNTFINSYNRPEFSNDAKRGYLVADTKIKIVEEIRRNVPGVWGKLTNGAYLPLDAGSGPLVRPLEKTPTLYRVFKQVGAFKVRENAQNMYNDLTRQGENAIIKEV